MEFFSGIDPLYRSYGKQEAIRNQSAYFDDASVEHDWLDYNARFRGQSNFTSNAASPFGDPDENDKSQDRFSISRGFENQELHERWRRARHRTAGFGDPEHPFRCQGSADLNLYKLFLEAAHTLLKRAGRLGFVVPSGLYSDNGTGALRRLFLDHCRWEWLFGIENRDKIFPIDSRFKFNPVVLEKGGKTNSIRTAFMRRSLDDWERGDELATSYTREQVQRFSPRSRAILEIQSQRDLEILEKIYANSVLLGDDGPAAWDIRYAREFDLTNDSHLFPPRPQWEAKDYRPDEYSRWLLGDWRPIDELWAEIGIDPSRQQPAEVALEDWLFDTTAGPARRAAEARFVHGHLMKPGDVARTAWRARCAQPPCDELPIPRADIPAGVILSRDGAKWIREENIEDTALPLYEGRMIGQFDFSQKGWVSGKGRSAVWRDIPWDGKQIEPQFLMCASVYDPETSSTWSPKIAHMDIGSATNMRSAIGSFLCGMPAGNSAPTLHLSSADRCLNLTAVFNSVTFDFIMRLRVTGLHLNYHILEQNPLPRLAESAAAAISHKARKLCLTAQWFAPQSLELQQWESVRSALTRAERVRLRAALDALVAASFGLEYDELTHILKDCDRPIPTARDGLDPKGFWRIDKDKEPELRHTVLTLVAFRDLEAKIEAAGGDRERGINEFLAQNDGEGWMLPETLCLADYGLGRDDRARRPQAVAGRFGPRFYDWQLAQSPDEAVRECHLHARNLLGVDGYARLLAELIEGCGGSAENRLALLTDRHTHRLLGDDGYVTALVEVRARRTVNDDAFWRAAAVLRAGGDPRADRYGGLLDRLHARGLLADADDRYQSGRNPPAAADALQVAESATAYQTAASGDERQGELFE